MKRTAVEWLEDKLNNVRPTQICSIETIKEWVEQAKAMEKEQIVKASAIAYQDMFGSDGTEYGEEYYNKIFKSE